MNILLFGAPGAGKGTQSELLVSREKMVQISTGDLFRNAIKNKTELGILAQSYMDKGALVPDSVVIGMVEEVLTKLSGTSFILDGYPRNIAQAKALDELLARINVKLDRAVFLDVPNEILMSRLTGRRVCKNCAAVYHVISKPSKADGVCDKCGGEVIQRNDDKADVIESRLKAYDEHTAPLKVYYAEQSKLTVVDGNRDSEAVYSNILGSVK